MMVQLVAAAARLAPVTVIVPPALVTVPPHCGDAGVPDPVTPLGKVSVKFNPETTVPAGFAIVKVSVEVPLIGMLAGAKAFVRLAVVNVTVAPGPKLLTVAPLVGVVTITTLS